MNKWLKFAQYVWAHAKCHLSANNICQICYQDNKSEMMLCAACFQALPWLGEACEQCAYPVQPLQDQCVHCRNTTLNVNVLRALFRYEPPVENWVKHLKYQRKLYLGYFFAQCMAASFRPITAIDAIIPVPLSLQRLKTRGYNQSLEIAKALGALLSLPVIVDGLQKHRTTKSQSELTKAQRLSNISPTDFVVTETLTGKRVLLIDDVYTTGTTIQCIAKMLRQHGIQSLEAWVICRSI